MMQACRSYIALVLLFAGCVRVPLPEEPVPIVCKATWAGLSKGMGVTDASSLESGGLGLFAWHTYEGTSFPANAMPYLGNCQFLYDGSTSSWRGGAYWPAGSWLHFFAYAPYRANVSTGALRFPSDDYSSGFPRIQYSPDPVAGSQLDLCLSAPILNRSATINGGVLPLAFTHILTRLRFQARWTGSPAQVADLAEKGRTVRMLSLSLDHIAGTNKLTYNSSSYLWDTPEASSYTDNYSLSVAGGSMTSVALPLAPAAFSSAFLNIGDGYLYLLPQDLSAAAVPATLTVRFGIFDPSGVRVGDAVEVVFTIGDLAQHLWAAGYELTYSITIDLTGHYIVDADVTFDCNAGSFLSGSDMNMTANIPGSFLGGNFVMPVSDAGGFGSDGASLVGSTAGSFNQ